MLPHDSHTSQQDKPVAAVVIHDNNQGDILSSLPPFPTTLSVIISHIDYLYPAVCVAGSAWGNQSRHVVLGIFFGDPT